MEYIIDKNEREGYTIHAKNGDEVFESWSNQGDLKCILMDLMEYHQFYADSIHTPAKPVRLTLQKGIFGLLERKMTEKIEKFMNF